MNVRAGLTLILVLSGSAAAPGQFRPAPLGDPAHPDIVVTLWTNSGMSSRVEWTEYDPARENVTSAAPYPALLETPFLVNQVRSCSIAELDGDALTDWVLLVHHDEEHVSTVEHWEGDEASMTFQRVLFEAAPPPARMIALTFGSLDGGRRPAILTIEDLTGSGPQVVRQYEKEGAEWFPVNEFPIGVTTDRFIALTVGDLNGDALTDVLLIRDSDEDDVSAIDHYQLSNGRLEFFRNLVTEPRDMHRFQALDLGSLNGTRTDLLVVDWFFFQLVHEVQRWEFAGNGIRLFQVVREAIPPAERLIDISFFCSSASPPMEETLATAGAATAEGPPNRKNRFISVTSADSGRSQAIRVRFVNLPGPFDVWNGMEFFVGQPFRVCENSAQGREVEAPDDCGPAGGLERTFFWAAPLVCDIDMADFLEWRGQCKDGTCDAGLRQGDKCATDEDCVEAVHIYHEGIVPGGVYDIQIVDAGVLRDESCYSVPLRMTQAGWGDICGPGPGGACTGVADGRADVAQDVLGLIDKFQNINALQKSRADIEPGDNRINNGPDFKVNISGDVLFALEAFQGFPYPFTPGDPCAPG